MAANAGRRECVQLLLEKGADVAVKDNVGTNTQDVHAQVLEWNRIPVPSPSRLWVHVSLPFSWFGCSFHASTHRNSQ